VSYFLAPGYRERLTPTYFHDDGMDAVWQPDVYPDAAALARVLGSRRIIDLGCGDGSKLAALHPEFEIVGIDIGANLDRSRERQSVGVWLELDLDSDDRLPLEDVSGSLFICADVLEHLRFPEKTLRRVREALDRGADALVLSTPERDLVEGDRHLGPPKNPAHVREWNSAELRSFLESCGLDGFYGLTRSNDYLDELHTTFVAVPGLGEERRRQLEAWFQSRKPAERRGIEHAAKLAAERTRLNQFDEAVRWYQEALATHQEQLAAANRRIAELEAARRSRRIPFAQSVEPLARLLVRAARRRRVR
jgi:SAM-dependent methyltransferase